MINTGTVRIVKTIICNSLIVWLTFMSVGANAHATSDAAHETLYTHDHFAEEKQNNLVAFDVASSPEASHADNCNHSHCGHGHAAGLLTRDGPSANLNTAIKLQTSRTSWATSHIDNNIERPKWPVTTPAVVSLLS